MLQERDKEVEWRCEGFVADGTLTVLAGSAGDGKTWLAHALAAGVARGQTVAGIRCEKGKALVIDAEMGARMSISRMRVAGIGAEFDLVDAMGFSLANREEFGHMQRDIEQRGSNLVIFDSLRKLTPGKRENESDDMAPIVADLARLARDTNSAIVLIHHRGKGSGHDTPAYRGSTAIGDQADAVFILSRYGDGRDLRRLTCKDGKSPRYAPEPESLYLRFAPDQGGFLQGDAPKGDDELRDEILGAAPEANWARLARAVGRTSSEARFKRVCAELEALGHKLVLGGSSANATPAGQLVVGE